MKDIVYNNMNDILVAYTKQIILPRTIFRHVLTNGEMSLIICNTSKTPLLEDSTRRRSGICADGIISCVKMYRGICSQCNLYRNAKILNGNLDLELPLNRYNCYTYYNDSGTLINEEMPFFSPQWTEEIYTIRGTISQVKTK